MCAESAQVPIGKPTCSKMEHLQITQQWCGKRTFVFLFYISATEESSTTG